MTSLKEKFTRTLGRYRTTGVLHVVYALAAEALLVGYLFFIGLFTAETLLPTFITARFSITKHLFMLIITTWLLTLLGRFLDLSFVWTLSRKSPLLWLGILWAISILTVSLFKFPLIFIPILIALFLFSGYLFWKIFFEENEQE